MPDYTDHSNVLELLKEAQFADQDQRDQAREAHLFIEKRDGQWEPFWWEANRGRPRYSFDMTTPVVDQIDGELSRANFAIEVDPQGGGADKETAKQLGGLVRSVEAISKAKHIYNYAARMAVISGLNGWMVTPKYADEDSFDQDLMIKRIPNFLDRVWFDPMSTEPDRSDSRHYFLLTAFSKSDYEEKWPEGSGQNVSADLRAQAYWNTPDTVMVGAIYYLKDEQRELVLMNNGDIYEADEKYEQVKDDLLRQNVFEVRRRKRTNPVLYVRQFDTNGWLDKEPRRTVFNQINMVPVYGNFSVTENKVIYRGVVEKAMDFQRVYNYAKSREIEEGSLAPRKKIWMTPEQAQGHEDDIETMNVNAKPVQLYNHVDGQVQPYEGAGAQVNQGLANLSNDMKMGLPQAAGLYSPSQGQQVNNQSGVALERLQNKGDNTTFKYFEMMEIAIGQTGKLIVDAGPKVYDRPGRLITLLNEDGTSDEVTLLEPVVDETTKTTVYLNDLSKGVYSVVCSSGPAFQNKQEKTVESFLEVAQIDPTLIQEGSDILLANVDAPGMSQMAGRRRSKLFEAGMIPESEWTDEEREKMVQMQSQPKAPDPAMVLAEAERMKAEADLIGAQNEQSKIQMQAIGKSIDSELESARLGLQQAELELKEERERHAMESQDIKMLMEQTTRVLEDNKRLAETLKVIKETMGADAVVSPELMGAFEEGSEDLNSQMD